MVNFKYNPNELGIKNVWWGKEEKYWIEISNKDKNEEHKKYRGDFGSDLRAPTKDWSGNRNVSMYSILGLVRPNDVIFHCSTTKGAIIGKSLASDFPYITQGTYFSPQATRFSNAPKFPKRTIATIFCSKSIYISYLNNQTIHTCYTNNQLLSITIYTSIFYILYF